MARIFMDGFETGDIYLWTTNDTSTANTTMAAGFSGTYCCFVSAGHIEKVLPSSKTELYIAFKYYTPNTYSYNSILTLKDSAGTIIASVSKPSSGFLTLRRGDAYGTLLATGTHVVGQKAFLIEVRYKPLNSGGVVQVKLDGVLEIDYSGDTTNGLEDVQRLKMGNEPNGTYFSGYFDDFIVDDANWIGNTKLGIIVPDGTGTTNNWTASAGNAWDCLNEKPPVDTDYVYSNTTNQIATYAMTTIASMNSVKSIQLQARAAYEGSPTPTKIQLGVRASGTDYFATDLSPPVSFGMLTKILELNPADSAAFEQADIDALEVGVKATA